MVFEKFPICRQSDNDERIRAFRHNNTVIILSKFVYLSYREVLKYPSRDS